MPKPPASTVQQEIRQAVLDVTGVESDELSTSIDGCSAPTFRLPLRALATGLARMANPGDLPPQRRLACLRIVDAVRSFPELVAGTSTPRFDTALIQATNGRLFSKVGAEGVQTVGIVDSGLGFAAKIDDGSTRALHRLTIAVLTRLGHLDADELASLKSWHNPVRRNRDQVEIGHYELVEDRLP